MRAVMHWSMWIPRDPPPPVGNPEDSDRVYLTQTGESDSLILTHLRDIWLKHFSPGEFWPQFEWIVAYFFNIFHLLPVNPHSLTQGFSDNKYSCFLFLTFSMVWYTTPIHWAFWHKNLYTPKGRNAFMTRNFWPIEGTLTTHFLKCQNPLDMPTGGGPWEFTVTSA